MQAFASEGYDADDFALEARLMKKLKQGKISKAEFYRQLGESDED